MAITGDGTSAVTEPARPSSAGLDSNPESDINRGMHSLIRCCLALAFAGALMAADDPIQKLRFSDGISRTAADFAGQNVLLFYFCGN